MFYLQKSSSKVNIYRIKKVLWRELSLTRLHDRKFCIVSNNCWGSSIYQDLQLEYNTPFVGLFLYSPCYIRLLSNLQYYLSQAVEIIETSKYPNINEKRSKRYFPTGLLGKDIEIQFLHYKTPQEALEKWNSRLARMDFNNLFLGYCDADLRFEEHFLHAFEETTYQHKVFFTANKRLRTLSSIYITECANQSHVTDLYTQSYLYKRHFDVVGWLNGGTGQPTVLYSLINKVLETKPLTPSQFHYV